MKEKTQGVIRQNTDMKPSNEDMLHTKYSLPPPQEVQQQLAGEKVFSELVM